MISSLVKVVIALVVMVIVLVLSLVALFIIGCSIVFCLDKLGLMSFTWAKGFWMSLLLWVVYAIYPKK